MQLTRYDRERLGGLFGALALAGHAVPVFWWARGFLMLPMEAGGLFLGPMLGFPLAAAGVGLLAGAVLLVMGRTPPMAIAALAVLTFADGCALFSGFRSPWLLAGVVVGAAALTCYASLVRLGVGTGLRRHTRH